MQMKNIAKILGLTMVGALIGVNCYASVFGVKEEQTNWNIVYPKVVIYNNQNSEYLINEDIQQHYSKIRSAFQHGEYYRVIGKCRLMYEDENLLSLVLYFIQLPYGGNGSHEKAIGLVYDKNTGQRIPIYNYVNATADDVYYYQKSHTYSFSKNQYIPPRYVDDRKVEEVPENYFLPGDGSVCLLYGSYKLAAGVWGVTYIKLEPEYIDYLSRKNG